MELELELKVVYYRNIKKVYDLSDNLISRDCSKCRKHLLVDCFARVKSKSYKDGVKGKCKDCEKEYFKQYAKTNEENLAEYRQCYYVENKVAMDAKNREYSKDNSEKMKEYQKNYREENSTKLKEYHKRWSSINREHLNKYKAMFNTNKRAIERKLPANLDKHGWEEILDAFDWKCSISLDDEITIDHFIPLSWGHGGTTKENCIPLHPSLNFSKNNKNPFDWAEFQIREGKISITLWQKLVAYLAEINNLSVSDYRRFVQWCYENQRNIENVSNETTSLELWINERGETK